MATHAQTEEEFLEHYDLSLYKRPSVMVDTVIFTVLDGALQVLTIKRANHPYKGQWSLVGGFIDVDNDADIEATARRKLEEKTGVKIPYLEQYGSIGNATRDPRGWSVTNIYFALIPSRSAQLQASEGAIDIKWSVVNHNRVEDDLAFDHAHILKGCIERLRNKALYTSLPVHLMRKTFTLRELQNVYEIIFDKKLEHKSFRRRLLAANILEESENVKHERGRPALLYKPKTRKTHFFMRNIEGIR